ncbi:hypothetical protein [Methanoregula sp.]|jgi:hypothetical protein|uniref:hypothetical protein n=1 Tax=Methanoregula sp. TaxID=2052170 RepID=UPI003565E21E
MLYETQFLLALAITIITEVTMLVALIRFVFRDTGIPIRSIIGIGALCTALTLPYLWFVWPPFVDAAYYPLIGELLVVLVEAGVLNQLLGLDVKRAAACSLIMNAVSFGIGLLVF